MKRIAINKLPDGTVRFQQHGLVHIWIKESDEKILQVLNELQELNSSLLEQVKEAIK